MQSLQFTKTNISALSFPEKAYIVVDEEMPYLFLRLGSRKKTFFFQRWYKDQLIKITIGDAMTINPILARKKCEEFSGMMSKGIDPRKPPRTTVTLREAYDEFKEKRELRKGTVRTYDTVMLTQLEHLLDKPINEITGDDVITVHTQFGKAGKKQYANQVMRTLRSVLNFARATYRRPDGSRILGENPVSILKDSKGWYKPKRRKTVITPEQLPTWIDFIGSMDNHVAGDLYLLMLLTGLRREEATRIEWKDVNFAQGFFSIPEDVTKNDEGHALPMTTRTRQIFERRRQRRINAWVFPGADTHVVNTRRQRDQIVEETNVIFTPHDLRRTFTTVAESLYLNDFLIKRLLNHKTDSDVTGGYIVWAPTRLLAPLQAIEDRIFDLAAGLPVESAADPLPRFR